MSGTVNRFLGDTPMRVVLKLVVLSFLLGIVMSTLGLTPFDVIDRIYLAIQHLWDLGFEAIGRFLGHMALGAAIVVPIFLIIRLLKYRA